MTKNVSGLAQKVGDLSTAVEKQEQHSRRNCFPEKKQENTNKAWIKAVNEHVHLDINDRDIDRTYRIGNPRNRGEKPRPVIIRLVRFNDRKKILTVRKS